MRFDQKLLSIIGNGMGTFGIIHTMELLCTIYTAAAWDGIIPPTIRKTNKPPTNQPKTTTTSTTMTIAVTNLPDLNEIHILSHNFLVYKDRIG